MPKIYLKTPEEYNTFSVLVDGNTYDNVTVDTPKSLVAEISKKTLLELESGFSKSEPVSLDNILEQIDELSDKDIEIEEKIADMQEQIDSLSNAGTTDANLDEIKATQAALAGEIEDLKNTCSILQNTLLSVNNEIAVIKQKLLLIEGGCPCCNQPPVNPVPPTDCPCC